VSAIKRLNEILIHKPLGRDKRTTLGFDVASADQRYDPLHYIELLSSPSISYKRLQLYFKTVLLIHNALAMRRSLRYRPLLKRILQLACILILVQSIVDYRRSNNIPTTTTITPLSPNQKIFVASIHWNNAPILRSHWVPAVLNLVEHFGKDNVYVSVQESGSWDDSKDALRELDKGLERLGARRRILLDETTHDDEIAKTPAESGWVRTPRGKTELRRVPYLAKLRNLVLEPLQELAEEGERFDRILFLNDVVFTVCSPSSNYSNHTIPFHVISPPFQSTDS
jgi:hypothetical protein